MPQPLAVCKEDLIVAHCANREYFEMDKLSESQSQESTEPVEWMDSGYEESQSQTQSEPAYWGRLYPLKSSLNVIDLVSNAITFGKRDTDVVFTSEHLPPLEDFCQSLPREIYAKCSKVHFRIDRKQINVMGAQATQVVITDMSSNGTFINKHVLKRKSSIAPSRYKVLSTNDIIGLPAGNPNVYDAYVFVDSYAPRNNLIPSRVQKKYEISRRLGAGAFGEVSLVFDKIKGRPFAMKMIVKDVNANRHLLRSCNKKLLNELQILKTVNHPNVIRLVDFLDCQKEHFLILEYMEGKDLSQQISQADKLDEDISKLYLYQIVKGVQYLHSQGIIHRDLKPENILLSSTKRETILKITDFGLSKVLSPTTMMKTQCGTKLYVAPEVLFGCGSYEYTEKVDVWSLGVMLYFCLSGTEPFRADKDEDSVGNLIKEASFSMPFLQWRSISNEAKLLVRRMIVKEPQERITIDNIINDQWMQDDEMLYKVEKLYSGLIKNFGMESCAMDAGDTYAIQNGNDAMVPPHSERSPPPKKVRTQ